MVIFQVNEKATVPEETNQREETTQEAPAVEQKLATTEVDVPPTESKTAEPDEVLFFPDEEDNKLADEEGNEAAVSPIHEEDLKFTEDIENEDQADLEGDNEIEDQ